MSYTPILADVIEPVIKAIKDELTELNIFDIIDEGEADPDTAYIGMRASVFPGKDVVTSIGMSQLQHTLAIFVIVTSYDEKMSPPEIRKQLHPVYDKLMADVTHDGTCWVCLPKYWHAGLMVWPSGQRLVGVLSEWEARIMQRYSPPHA